MQTILNYWKGSVGGTPAAGGSICDNAPLMELFKAVDMMGPCGLSALSVAHYGEQNADRMLERALIVLTLAASAQHASAWGG